MSHKSVSVEKPRIVILGAGFGGMYAYKKLYSRIGKKASYTIINKTNHFLFTPLLHEVATGLLEGYHIVEPVRKLIHQDTTKCITGSMVSIDSTKQVVVTEDAEIPYDFLIIATGAVPNYFGIQGAEEYSLPLKSLRDAFRIRDRVIESFEKALHASTPEERKSYLSFIVIGGGPTGVELVAEIGDMCFRTFLKYYKSDIKKEDITVAVVSATEELVPTFEPKVRRIAQTVLKKKGVSVYTNTFVVAIDEEGILLKDGTTMFSKNVFFSAGVKAQAPLFSDLSPQLTRSGRLVVDDTLRIPTMANVFAIGDVATTLDAEGHELSMLAQVAQTQGVYVGRTIANILKNKSVKKYKSKLRGELLSLGEWKATGDIFGMTVNGPLAWFLWRTIYLFKFISPVKRARIAFDWTLAAITSRDITRISK